MYLWASLIFTHIPEHEKCKNSVNTRIYDFTVQSKPVNKGHPNWKTAHGLYRQVVFFGGYIVLLNQGRVTGVWSLFTGWPLFWGDL